MLWVIKKGWRTNEKNVYDVLEGNRSYVQIASAEYLPKKSQRPTHLNRAFW